MKENSIEEDIKTIENYLKNSAINETDSNFFRNGGWEIVDLEIPKVMQHILLNLKKILKENEQLKNAIAVANKLEELIKEDFIPKGKIVDIIEKLNIDIERNKRRKIQHNEDGRLQMEMIAYDPAIIKMRLLKLLESEE